MSAAIALMLLAEAATSCALAPARELELPGGATIVRPVGTSDPVPFEPLGPAPAVSKPHSIQQADAPVDAGASVDDPSSDQCEALPPPNV